MSDVKIRLQEIVGSNISKFARMIGENRQTIDNYLLGRMPRGAFLKKLAEKFNININWLLTGKGPKELSAAVVREKKALYNTPAINIITSQEYKKLLKYQSPVEDCIPIPIISEPIVASNPLSVKEKDIEGFVFVNQAWLKRGHTYLCFRVQYNCMHPVICEGFIVAIDLNENEPLKLKRQIVATRFEDGISLKYLILTEKDYVLLPHNTAEHKPIVIPRTAPNPIIGKVCWWWGNQK
ncbi:hypothetical protein CEE39_02735 [bacterium (candidate division B38) B3_B38]|nr:MAG: hypothetical protein CEE39_02735 [bacterium (candidate division B38) B3_B38]